MLEPLKQVDGFVSASAKRLAWFDALAEFVEIETHKHNHKSVIGLRVTGMTLTRFEDTKYGFIRCWVNSRSRPLDPRRIATS